MTSTKETEEIEWTNASTLADWAERMFRQGKRKEVMSMISFLPEGSKTKERVLKFLKAIEDKKKLSGSK